MLYSEMLAVTDSLYFTFIPKVILYSLSQSYFRGDRKEMLCMDLESCAIDLGRQQPCSADILRESLDDHSLISQQVSRVDKPI